MSKATLGMFDQINIQAISAIDLYHFCDLLMEATHWTEHNGESMWNKNTLSPHVLLSQYRLEDLFLAYHEGEPVAALIMNQKSGWPELDEFYQGNALFIHKLVVKPCYRGTGLCELVLRWARKLCAKHHAGYLLLMCHCENRSLRRHWVEQGFAEVEAYRQGMVNRARRYYVMPADYRQQSKSFIYSKSRVESVA